MLKNIKNNVILSLILKSIFISLISIFAFVYVCSFLILHIDIPKEYYSYFAFCIVGISSFVTAFLSTKKYSNSYLLLSLISCISLFCITIINCFITKEYIYTIVNIAIIITCCIISSLINSKYNKRF